jgi:hypothetical protein
VGIWVFGEEIPYRLSGLNVRIPVIFGRWECGAAILVSIYKGVLGIYPMEGFLGGGGEWMDDLH